MRDLYLAMALAALLAMFVIPVLAFAQDDTADDDTTDDDTTTDDDASPDDTDDDTGSGDKLKRAYNDNEDIGGCGCYE
jgi:hypothetical protein